MLVNLAFNPILSSLESLEVFQNQILNIFIHGFLLLPLRRLLINRG